jgi:hypothetical protein
MVRIARMRQAGVMPQLPTPLRAALGLAAEAAEQARHLPDRAIELPMLAISTALQVSLRAQQRYAMLAARGDDLLNRRPTTDEPPPWATFDGPVDAAAPAQDQVPPADAAVIAKAVAAEAVASSGDAGPAADNAPLAGVTDLADAPKPYPRKTVRKPRNTKPSRFDTVGDE